jgi:virginiamycin B lyase
MIVLSQTPKYMMSFGAAIVLITGLATVQAKSHDTVALTGIIGSEGEKSLEGVLVSAKSSGETVTVTVVTDKEGRYSFDANRLKPGTYNIAIRAIGYDLATPNLVAHVDTKPTELDIKLTKTRDLASQLSAAEWLMSVPGTPAQKDQLYTCIECHTATPIVSSKYDAAGWEPTIGRMRNYSPQSVLTAPIMLPYHETQRPSDAEFAKYLSSINLSSKSKWDFDLKTLPRPAGADTRVVITEYDLPNPNRQPHDVVIDAEGMIWYDDFALPILGRLNPRTGEVKEWNLPELKPGFPDGALDLELDSDGNPWIARVFQAGVSKFDKKTEKIVSWKVPAQYDTPHTRTTFLAIAPQHFVWLDDSTGRRMDKLDPATGKIETYPTFPGWDRPALDIGVGMKGNHGEIGHLVYGIGVDSNGVGYLADRAGGNIGEIDPHTGKVVFYPTPSPNSGPRRLHIDGEDQVWFAENYALNFAHFDPKTKQFQEWPDPTPWDAPYDVVRDKDGYLWTGGMTTDLVTRFNPKTGQFAKYLLPGLGVNIRRVEIDNSSPRPTFWVGENHRAKIAKVEPLE